MAFLSEDDIQTFSPDMQDDIRKVSDKFDTSMLKSDVPMEVFVQHLVDIGLFKNIKSVKFFLIDESITQLRLYNHDLPIVYYSNGEEIADNNKLIDKCEVTSDKNIKKNLNNKSGE